VLRVSLAGAAARAFAKRRWRRLGRPPPCPFCSNPLDPEGQHLPPGQRIPTLSTAPQPPSLPAEDDLLALLSHGELEIHGRLTDASNATLYAVASLDGIATGCVYKPVAGRSRSGTSRPARLARRETAAYRLSPPAASGWCRDRAAGRAFGLGSVQWWVTVTTAAMAGAGPMFRSGLGGCRCRPTGDG